MSICAVVSIVGLVSNARVVADYSVAAVPIQKMATRENQHNLQLEISLSPVWFPLHRFSNWVGG